MEKPWPPAIMQASFTSGRRANRRRPPRWRATIWPRANHKSHDSCLGRWASRILDLTQFATQPVGNGLEGGLLRPPVLRKLTMALHDVPAQIVRGEFVAVEFQRLDHKLGTQLGDIEQPI